MIITLINYKPIHYPMIGAMGHIRNQYGIAKSTGTWIH